MEPIRNPNWSTSGMRVTLSYLETGVSGENHRPQYLNVLSGEIEKNLYSIYMKTYNIQILYRFFSISPDKTSRYCAPTMGKQLVNFIT